MTRLIDMLVRFMLYTSGGDASDVTMFAEELKLAREAGMVVIAWMTTKPEWRHRPTLVQVGISMQ